MGHRQPDVVIAHYNFVELLLNTIIFRLRSCRCPFSTISLCIRHHRPCGTGSAQLLRWALAFPPGWYCRTQQLDRPPSVDFSTTSRSRGSQGSLCRATHFARAIERGATLDRCVANCSVTLRGDWNRHLSRQTRLPSARQQTYACHADESQPQSVPANPANRRQQRAGQPAYALLVEADYGNLCSAAFEQPKQHGSTKRGIQWLTGTSTCLYPSVSRCAVPMVCDVLQAIAKSRGTSTAELLRPIIQAFDSILERRLLPIRSITAQVRTRRCPFALPNSMRGVWQQFEANISHRMFVLLLGSILCRPTMPTVWRSSCELAPESWLCAASLLCM